MQNPTCIHQVCPTFRAADSKDPACRRPAASKKTHGYLCIEHYRQEQASIPAKPRLPQPKWRGLQPPVQTDAEIIQDIRNTEERAIAFGNVRAIRFGSIEPIYLRVLLPPTVH